jgi:hypothetical protein
MAGMALVPRLLLRRVLSGTCLVLAALMPAFVRAETPQLKSTEMADQAVCRVVESAAGLTGIPVALLTRLVWLESRFRPDTTSPAGAQGIAQFMPATAAERGLANPFDPEQAIPRAAEFLADLDLRFGNIGLAVAAYNAGPNRVQNWLAGTSLLPAETRAYVQALTGRTAQDWATERDLRERAEHPIGGTSCAETVASLRNRDDSGIRIAAPDFSIRDEMTMHAIADFERARHRYCHRLHPAWPKATAVALVDPPLPSLCIVHPHDRQ